MRGRAIVIAVLALLPATAHATEMHFLAELGAGASIPVADERWAGYAQPGFVGSVRAGGEIWLARHVALVGDVETAAGYVPLRPFGGWGASKTARVRQLIGARLVFGFGPATIFFRQAIGFDFQSEAISGDTGGVALSLAVQLGVGAQLYFARKRGTVGITAEIPFAFFPYQVNMGKLGVDVQLLGFIGVRL